jgi:hypothetical protein
LGHQAPSTAPRVLSRSHSANRVTLEGLEETCVTFDAPVINFRYRRRLPKGGTRETHDVNRIRPGCGETVDESLVSSQ